MMDGGITVSKSSTGSHLIEDLQILVTHKDPVYIPAHKVVSSTDLHRALGSKILFQLTSTMPTQGAKQGSLEADQVKLQALELENRLLREALTNSTSSTQALEKRVASLVGAVEKLAAAPPQVVQVVAQGAVLAALKSEVVGGEVPMFLPNLAPKEGVDVQVKIQAGTSDGSSVSEAANRLRQLRKEQAG